MFERGLDPDKRSQLGAHYTDRAKIEMLIDPVIRRPLLAEWQAVQGARSRRRMAQPANGRRGRNGGDSPQAAVSRVPRTAARFRVLDPACGSGNFLYLSLQALKDLEHQASVEAEALGLQREFPQVGPETMLGIEINPYAAELARVSVWIGHIQWTRRHGYAAPSDPVLQPLDTIECRDAILTPDGRAAEWPPVDVIVGNPPFLGGKLMRRVLDDELLRHVVFGVRRPGAGGSRSGLLLVRVGAQPACFRKSEECRPGRDQQHSWWGEPRSAEPIRQSSVIHDAWSDEAWTVEGAAVRVSLICFADPAYRGSGGAERPSDQ